MSTKRCPKCRLEKDVSEFGKDARSKDGLYTYCKACHNAKSNESQARLVPLEDGTLVTANRKSKSRPVPLEDGTLITAGALADRKSKARLVVSPKTGNLITANSAYKGKHFTQSTYYQLKAWISKETRELTWAVINGTSNQDMRFQRLFGVSRDEFKSWLENQCKALSFELSDYQTQWQLDHRVPLGSAQSSNELMALARIGNCQVIGIDQHATKSREDVARIKQYEA